MLLAPQRLWKPKTGAVGPPTIDSGWTIYEGTVALTTHDIAEPAGTGGKLVAILGTTGSNGTINLPAGWDDILNVDYTSGQTHLRAVWKDATGGVDDITFTLGGARRATGTMFRVQGGNIISGTPGSINTGTPTDPDCPAITTLHDNALVVRAFSRQYGNWEVEDDGYPTDHTGLYIRTTLNASDSNHTVGGVAWETLLTAGSTGNALFVQPAPTFTRRTNGMTFAIAP